MITNVGLLQRFMKHNIYKTAVRLQCEAAETSPSCRLDLCSPVRYRVRIGGQLGGTECGFSTWDVFAAGHPLIAETTPFHQSTCLAWCCLREVQMNTRLYRAFLLITRRSWCFSHCYSERDSVQCSIAKWNLRVIFFHTVSTTYRDAVQKTVKQIDTFNYISSTGIAQVQVNEIRKKT